MSKYTNTKFLTIIILLVSWNTDAHMYTLRMLNCSEKNLILFYWLWETVHSSWFMYTINLSQIWAVYIFLQFYTDQLYKKCKFLRHLQVIRLYYINRLQICNIFPHIVTAVQQISEVFSFTKSFAAYNIIIDDHYFLQILFVV